ncbi:MAG: tyrosine-protein phosphatase [Bacteriovoracaceae bacterium]
MKIVITLVIYLLLNTQLFAQDKAPIKNFSQVNNGIYRGGRLNSLEATQFLKIHKIKNVINLQGGDFDTNIQIVIPWVEAGETPENIAIEKNRVLALKMGYFHAPLSSLKMVDKNSDKVINKILSFMHDKKNQPIYIHCEHGADRTGLLIALYKVKYLKMNPQLARLEWIVNGHSTLHQIFTYKLDLYFFNKIKELN